MIVLKVEKDAETLEDLKLTYIKGMAGWDRDTHMHLQDLERGEYYVYSELDWPTTAAAQDFNTDYCLTCYGASKSFFLRDEKSLFDKVEFLKKVYAAKVERAVEFEIAELNFADKGAPEIRKYKNFGAEGYGFIYIKNESSSATFNEKCVFNTFKGIEMTKP